MSQKSLNKTNIIDYLNAVSQYTNFIMTNILTKTLYQGLKWCLNKVTNWNYLPISAFGPTLDWTDITISILPLWKGNRKSDVWREKLRINESTNS